ncbi:alpha/beta fold hydrolase [Roseateles sp. LYH14W]|uniref:Alpha/beta fold hydrolase n=1 Tax=Pelomonas parva TaxID=3299032 RepID=A0ABW7EX81_9BURK
MKTLLLATSLALLPLAAHAQAPFDGARISQVAGFDGVPLNMVQKGEPGRPAVLFLHGYKQSYLSWSAQFGSDLAKRCHLVAYDLRGHGNSGQPWQAGAYDNSRPWADDMAAVIKASGLVKPLVVAWSFGGNVAMDFLRHHADVPIAGLVLVSSPAGLLTAPGSAPANAPRPPALDLAHGVAAAERSAQFVFGSGVEPALRVQLTAASMRVGPYLDSAMAVRGAGANADLLPALTALPLTLALGGRDPIVPTAVALKLRAALPGARVVEFPEAGHAMFAEADAAARFNAVLDELQCTGQR